MAQPATQQSNSGRRLAQARRKAMSNSGKAAIGSVARTASSARGAGLVAATSRAAASATLNGRQASQARRKALSLQGKSAVASGDRTRAESLNGRVAVAQPADQTPSTDNHDSHCQCQDKVTGTAEGSGIASAQPPARMPARQPRKVANSGSSNSCRALSLSRRKALSALGKAGLGANAADGSGNSQPATAQTASAPEQDNRPIRPSKKFGLGYSATQGAAQDAPWKVGASETAQGQTVTGTMIGHSGSLTGDDISLCREITGTEYLGADIFKSFCQTEPAKSPQRSGISITHQGNQVSGNRLEQSEKVTGNEAGSGQNVTGDEYASVRHGSSTLNGRAAGKGARPASVISVPQNRNSTITGDNVGRSDKVTGHESGANRDLTGTQYTGAQGSSAMVTKMPSTSSTANPGTVTGTMTGRGDRVTGNEPGRCAAVSGTPYVVQQAQMAGTYSATPDHPGADQAGDEANGQDFSIVSPARAAHQTALVTGSRYGQGCVTGPFGMADGKVTGTEEARFDQPQTATSASTAYPKAKTISDREVPRISGEGMDAGPKITGDDWDRGDHVTGTEGTSATKRNVSMRGGNAPQGAMANIGKRDRTTPVPVSKVTGGSGNTDHGALITYSGGARG